MEDVTEVKSVSLWKGIGAALLLLLASASGVLFLLCHVAVRDARQFDEIFQRTVQRMERRDAARRPR